MTPSQRDEDLKAFERYWGRPTELKVLEDTWHAALEYERERVKREATREESKKCPVTGCKCQERITDANVEEDVHSGVVCFYCLGRFNDSDETVKIYDGVTAHGFCSYLHGGDRPEPRLQDDEQCCKICPKCIAIVLKK